MTSESPRAHRHSKQGQLRQSPSSARAALSDVLVVVRDSWGAPIVRFKRRQVRVVATAAVVAALPSGAWQLADSYRAIAVAGSDGVLGAIGQESTLRFRYSGQFLGERDCDILDRSGKFLGSVVWVEGTRFPFGRFALANLRGQLFALRDRESRCVRRIEGPTPDHEASVIVTDQHGTEVVAIKCPDKLGVFDRLRAAFGRSRFSVEAGGKRLGAMTLNGQIYDTANRQVVRLRKWGGRVWSGPEYMITFIEPLDEELRVAAVAAAMLQQGTEAAPKTQHQLGGG